MDTALFFGHIDGVSVGDIFPNRRALHESGVHRPIQAGISGREKEGAESIVVSGGYEDDEDFGHVIIYTGAGGRNPDSGKQVEDQKFKRGNKALALNKAKGLPVRVIRAYDPKANVHETPWDGYRYDGLFQVADFWAEKGQSGFSVWRFRLEAIDEHTGTESPEDVVEEPLTIPGRKVTVTNRIIRDNQITRKVKAIHKNKCQVCDVVLDTPLGPYAEAAHIKPLGSPHRGPDVLGNVLCLCPNHHAQFDLFAFTIADDLTLVGMAGSITTDPQHTINQDMLAYHRQLYFAIHQSQS